MNTINRYKSPFNTNQTGKRISLVYILLAFLTITSCEDFVQVDPPKTQLTSDNVFSNEATALSALTGIYGQMMEGPDQLFNGSVTLYTGLSADELTTVPTRTAYNEFYTNSLNPANTSIYAMWSTAYSYIYQANAIIEGVSGSTSIGAAAKSQLIGEARFIRALSHFYLVNMFGDVPIVLTTAYETNALVKRAPVSEVYAQILSDLKEAGQSLGEEYVTTDRTRPNQSTVSALISRVYLYIGDWANAEKFSAALIGNALYTIESDLGNVFLPSSTEAIWQLAPARPGINNTGEGFMFIQDSGLPVYGVLSESQRNQFEEGDQRAVQWIGSWTDSDVTYYYPFKYKVETSETIEENYIVFRLSEQFLIRAEALVHLGNLNEAVSMLDVIRLRAGLPSITETISSNADEILEAIMHERRSELFAEWGHRWFDLKRTGQANATLATKGNWQSTDQLFPIPLKQIQNDPAMAMSQNPGY